MNLAEGRIFEQIQKEMVAWQEYNFPGRENWMPLMGLGEEIGELASATDQEEADDAIGDCCIYLADYCNAANLNMMELRVASIQLEFTKYITMADISAQYGKMCHAHLKMTQKIRMHEDHDQTFKDAAARIIRCLNFYCDGRIEEIAWEVWLKVRERDWQKNRNTAHLGGE